MKDKHPKDDTKLIDSCVNGDLAAWAALTQKYSALIKTAIACRLKKYGFSLPLQDIEDIRQTILTAIWRDRKLEGIKNKIDISCWLAIVSGNIAVEYLRKKRIAGEPKLIPLFDTLTDKEMAEFMPSAGRDPSDELARDELSLRIDEAIESLPSKERLIIKLNICHDKKFHEIAEMLNIPKGTVCSYIKRAKDKLREMLKDL